MSVIQSKVEPFQTHTPAPITLAYISVSSCYANPQKDLFQDQELFMKTRATISDVSGGAIYSPLGDIKRPSPLTHYLNGNRGLANGPKHKSITIACRSSRWSLAEWARHFLLSNFLLLFSCFEFSNECRQWMARRATPLARDHSVAGEESGVGWIRNQIKISAHPSSVLVNKFKCGLLHENS